MISEDFKEKNRKIIDRFYNESSESLNLCTYINIIEMVLLICGRVCWTIGIGDTSNLSIWVFDE